MTWKDEYAFGGIVFNESGQVLMRSPKGHWGGYVWTFAKGGAEPSDKSPEETALREVQEETGYECEIVAKIPGEFQSDTCVTQYFLMRPTGRVTDFDHETQEVRWVNTEDAFKMIQLTKSAKGRLRDTCALRKAIETWESIHVCEHTARSKGERGGVQHRGDGKGEQAEAVRIPAISV